MEGIIQSGAILGLGGFAVSALACWLLLRFWPFAKCGRDAGDMARKSQEKPVLRLGGVAIAVALVIVVAVSDWVAGGAASSRIGDPWGLLLICLLFFGIGLFDDLSPIPASLKLGLQVLVAVVAYMMGFRIESVTNPLNGSSFDLGGLAFLVTLLWLVSIPNLINLIDGLDGVAGGVVIALVGTLGVVSWMGADLFFTLICLGMIGVVVGFLCFNLPRARLYLGDGGAYLLGAFIAVSSVSASQKGAVAGALFVVALALALPIADSIFSIVRRALYGLPIWRADSEHIHHRLVTLGFRKCVIVGGMVTVVLVFSGLGLSLLLHQGQIWPILLTAIVVGGVFSLRLLGRWGRSPKALLLHLRRIVMTREKVRYACALGTVLEHEIDRAGEAGEFWGNFESNLVKVGLFPISEGAPEGRGGGADALEGGGESEGLETIRIPLADGSVWYLRHRSAFREMRWGKVACCFIGPLSRGIRRWGPPPDRMSLVMKAEKESISDYQSRLIVEKP